MLTGRDIIVFSDDWGRHPFSCQHIMAQFLPENRIIWVQTIGMRSPRFTLYDLRRSFQKLRSFIKPAAPSKPLPVNLTLLNPFMLPFGNPLVRGLNRYSVIRRVRNSLAQLRFRDPILLTTLPNAADYLGAFDEILSLFYCVDEFSQWPGVNRPLVELMERKLLQRVDLVVAVSDALCASKRPANGSGVRLLTHGVDAAHFGRAALVTANPGPVTALGDIPGPIIGYFGLFDQRSDQDLLEFLLKSRPDWSLVILGTAVAGYEKLSRYSNFFHREAVPYDELPEYVSYFSVCILPYVRTLLTDNINPLKLKEYLATGKPVVATAIPECRRYESVIRVADSHDEFLAAVIETLSEGCEKGAERKRAVVGDTWRDRAERLSRDIEERLADKKAKKFAGVREC